MRVWLADILHHPVIKKDLCIYIKYLKMLSNEKILLVVYIKRPTLINFSLYHQLNAVSQKLSELTHLTNRSYLYRVGSLIIVHVASDIMRDQLLRCDIPVENQRRQVIQP